MKPLIGLSLGYHDFDDYLAVGYHKPIALSGGLPIALPRLSEVTDDLLERCQGLMIAGGRDVEPHRYGQLPDPRLGPVDPRRDEFELDLIRRAIDRGMPVIAICRGIQSLNVALGGTLVQDLSLEPRWAGHPVDPGGRLWVAWEAAALADEPLPEFPHHPIRIEPGSHLHEALGVDEVEVDSFHHQAVGEVGRGLLVTATSPDGVIEALEMKEPWVLGLQCEMHEEWRIDRGFLRPFELFVEAAIRYAVLQGMVGAGR